MFVPSLIYLSRLLRMQTAQSYIFCNPGRSVEPPLAPVLRPTPHSSVRRSPAGQRSNRSFASTKSCTDRAPVHSEEPAQGAAHSESLAQTYREVMQINSASVWPFSAGCDHVCSFPSCPAEKIAMNISNCGLRYCRKASHRIPPRNDFRLARDPGTGCCVRKIIRKFTGSFRRS